MATSNVSMPSSWLEVSWRERPSLAVAGGEACEPRVHHFQALAAGVERRVGCQERGFGVVIGPGPMADEARMSAWPLGS